MKKTGIPSRRRPAKAGAQPSGVKTPKPERRYRRWEPDAKEQEAMELAYYPEDYGIRGDR